MLSHDLHLLSAASPSYDVPHDEVGEIGSGHMTSCSLARHTWIYLAVENGVMIGSPLS